MLTVVCWLWHGWRLGVYDAERVNLLARMLRDNTTIPYRLVCITDLPKGITECETFPLWRDTAKLKNPRDINCYRRLRLFDENFTRGELGAEGAVVSLDLDCVIMSNIDALLSDPAPFRAVHNGLPGMRYNGSMWKVQPGHYQELWNDFDPARTPTELKKALGPGGYKLIGSDQAWMCHKLPADLPVWGAAEGVYQFRRAFRKRTSLGGADACLWFFAGGDKPWHRSTLERLGAKSLHDKYMSYARNKGPSTRARAHGAQQEGEAQAAILCDVPTRSLRA